MTANRYRRGLTTKNRYLGRFRPLLPGFRRLSVHSTPTHSDSRQPVLVPCNRPHDYRGYSPTVETTSQLSMYVEPVVHYSGARISPCEELYDTLCPLAIEVRAVQ